MFICVRPKSCFNFFFPECDYVLDDNLSRVAFFLFIAIIYYIILYFLLSYNFRVKSNLGIIKVVLKINKLSSWSVKITGLSLK